VLCGGCVRTHTSTGWTHEGSWPWARLPGRYLVALLGTTQGMPQFEGSGGHVNQSSSIDAMVLHGGPYDLGPLAREMSAHPTADSPASLKAVSMLLGGNTDPSSKAYRDASPATYASPKSAPTLLLHGQNDAVVPNSEAVRFATLLAIKRRQQRRADHGWRGSW
jgi:hypothetical protein